MSCRLPNLNINCIFLRQGDALGLGHAVLCAEPVIGDEPFVVILADELLRAPKGLGDDMNATAQLCRAHAQLCPQRGAVIAVGHMEGGAISNDGVNCKYSETVNGAMRLTGIVEKPKPQDTPSQHAAIGRYVLPSSIFTHLRQIGKGAGGEIQLTDAIASLLHQEPVWAVSPEGVRYDCGTKIGYLEATVKLALERTEFGDDFARFLKLIRY